MSLDLSSTLVPVLKIRIRRIHMFLGLPDLDSDPLVRGTDPALNPYLSNKGVERTEIMLAQ
jgi:hypothetical protein